MYSISNETDLVGRWCTHTDNNIKDYSGLYQPVDHFDIIQLLLGPLHQIPKIYIDFMIPFVLRFGILNRLSAFGIDVPRIIFAESHNAYDYLWEKPNFWRNL